MAFGFRAGLGPDEMILKLASNVRGSGFRMPRPEKKENPASGSQISLVFGFRPLGFDLSSASNAQTRAFNPVVYLEVVGGCTARSQ